MILEVKDHKSKIVNSPAGGREGGCDCDLVRAEQSSIIDQIF